MRGHNNGGRQPNQRPSNSGIYNGEWLPQNSMETGQAQFVFRFILLGKKIVTSVLTTQVV
jgi:hypothetical protein